MQPHPTPADTALTVSGKTEIRLGANHTFRFLVEGNKTPEVYGWVEDDLGQTIKGHSGFYRTSDPAIAAKIAASNLGLTMEPPQ